ncbi:MAG TPA: hypothetical protein VMS17_17320 [Gemmataceae bacterium]|nr:hypothetical protein [Gemmataceae bacterium]
MIHRSGVLAMALLFADPPSVPAFWESLTASPLLLYGGIAAAALVVLLILVALLRRGRRKPVDPESGLDEDLSEYPPPPANPGPRRLTVHGRPVRLRLVVIAPVGKRKIAGDGAVEALLDQVLRGLGQVAMQDKPRVRVWPPQLSQQGFAPTFFRRTQCPDRAGKPSRWLMAAGPVRAGGTPALLGLAMWADDQGPMEQMILSETEWNDALQMKTM